MTAEMAYFGETIRDRRYFILRSGRTGDGGWPFHDRTPRGLLAEFRDHIVIFCVVAHHENVDQHWE